MYIFPPGPGPFLPHTGLDLLSGAVGAVMLVGGFLLMRVASFSGLRHRDGSR